MIHNEALAMDNACNDYLSSLKIAFQDLKLDYYDYLLPSVSDNSPKRHVVGRGPVKPSVPNNRNKPCRCGSGIKTKKCCKS